MLWAMRDRLISIAAPAEPEPPRFRVVTPPPSMPSTDSVTDDLTEVTGIGPVFAARLRAAGIDTFKKLAATDDERLAEIADVPVSRVEGWRDQASRH